MKKRARWNKVVLAAAAVIVPALSCGQRSLVLIDVKASNAFTDPSALLSVHLTLTANHGVTTRFREVRLQPDVPYQIGMYLPSDMTGTVTFEAQIDNGDCEIGTGSATATGVQSGETSSPIPLTINPTSPPCIPIGDGGLGGSGTGGTTGTAGAGGMTGAGGTTGAGGGGGMSGVSGTTGTAGAGGMTGAAGRGGASGPAGASGTTGTAGAGGIGGIGGLTGTAGRGGNVGTAGVGGVSGTAGVGGMTGMAGRGGTTGTAGIGGVTGTAGMGGMTGTAGRGGTTGAGGLAGIGGSGPGGGGGGGAGGVGPGVGGSTGVGGTFTTSGAGGAGGSSSCGGTSCAPPFVCDSSGACVCSETPAQACARAMIPCGYVYDNCGQQQFCACKIVNTICDTVNQRCSSGCTTGTGGIVTADIICPVDPAP